MQITNTSYLDNAATSYPKPQVIYGALRRAVSSCVGNPGRGGHYASRNAAKMLYDARVLVSSMHRSDHPECVVFAHNATEALNMAIKGFVKSKCHILISDIEHNSVRRAVCSLAEKGCTYSVYSTSGGDDAILASINSKIQSNTAILIACHRSNICSRELPIERIGKLCRRKNIRFIVDASQSVGACEIGIGDVLADAICAPGHKGLYGIMGSGYIIYSDRVNPHDIKTLYEGGSGVNSESEHMPELLPERLEAGTVPLPAIATLAAGCDYVMRTGAKTIGEWENTLMRGCKERLCNINGVKVYLHDENRGSVLIFNVEGYDSEEVASILDSKGIFVRAGLHCSPLAHQSIVGSLDGAVRASFGYFNTPRDVERLSAAVSEIARRR